MNLTIWTSAIVLVVATTGCITKRTVTEHGRTVEEKIVIKRPIKNAIESVEFE